jgi:mono/diheme cytochrome c family protein
MKATTRLLPFLFIAGALAAQEGPSPASGKEIYLAYCAACHGMNGKGDGRWLRCCGDDPRT